MPLDAGGHIPVHAEILRVFAAAFDFGAGTQQQARQNAAMAEGLVRAEARKQDVLGKTVPVEPVQQHSCFTIFHDLMQENRDIFCLEPALIELSRLFGIQVPIEQVLGRAQCRDLLRSGWSAALQRAHDKPTFIEARTGIRNPANINHDASPPITVSNLAVSPGASKMHFCSGEKKKPRSEESERGRRLLSYGASARTFPITVDALVGAGRPVVEQLALDGQAVAASGGCW